MDDPNPNHRELLWRDYALTTQLYQFYFEMTLKTITAIYAITGAIISFCLSRSTLDFVRWALFFPFLVNIFFTFMFALTSNRIGKIRADAISIAKELGVPPRDFSPLMYALAGFSVLNFICTVGIAWLLWIVFHPTTFKP